MDLITKVTYIKYESLLGGQVKRITLFFSLEQTSNTTGTGSKLPISCGRRINCQTIYEVLEK